MSVIPEPKEIVRKEGRLNLSPQIIVSASHNLLYQQVEKWIGLIEEKFKYKITISKKVIIPEGNHFYTLSLSSAKTQSPTLRNGFPNPQCYFLKIDSSIQLLSPTKEGIFYGLQTLIQLASPNKGYLSFPKLLIKDWPDISLRGLHFIPEGYRMDYLKKMVRILAQYKMNALMLDFYGTFKFKRYPVGDRGAMTPTEVKELINYAQEWQIEIFPSVASFAHVTYILKHNAYSYLREDGHPFQFCPTHPGSFRLIKGLYQEVLPLFKSSYFHIGGDEVWFLGACPRCASRVKEIGLGGLYLEFILHLYHFLKIQSKTMVLWGDMLLHFPDIIKSIPKDIVVMNWNYGHQKDYPDKIKFPSVNFFKAEGIKTMVASAATASQNYTYAAHNSQNLCRVAHQAGTLGAFVTTWPGAQTEMDHLWYPVLALAEYGWSTHAEGIDNYQRKFCQSFYGLESKRLLPVIEVISDRTTFPLLENFPGSDWLKIDPQKAEIFLRGIKNVSKRVERAFQTIKKILPEARYPNSSLKPFLTESWRISYEIKHHITLAKINMLLAKATKTYQQGNREKTNQVLKELLVVVKTERNELSALINELNKRWFLTRTEFEPTNIFKDPVPGRTEIIKGYQNSLEELNRRIKILSYSPDKFLTKISLVQGSPVFKSVSMTPRLNCWLKRSHTSEGYKIITIGNSYWEIELMPELGGRIMRVFSHSLGRDVISNRYEKALKERSELKQYNALPNWGGIFERVFYNGEYLPVDLELLPGLPYSVHIIRNSPSEIKIDLNCRTHYLNIKRRVRLVKGNPYLYISTVGQPTGKEAVVALESVVTLKELQGDDYRMDSLVWQEDGKSIKMSLLVLPRYKIIEPDLPWLKIESFGQKRGLLIEFGKRQLSSSEPVGIQKMAEDYCLVIKGQRKILLKNQSVELEYRMKAI